MCPERFSPHKPPSRVALGFVALAICAWAAHPSTTFAADPIAELRKVIQGQQPTDFTDPKQLGDWEKALKAKIDRVRSIGDLRRALILGQWPNLNANRATVQISQRLRKILADRLEEKIKAVVRSGDATKCRAVADQVGALYAQEQEFYSESETQVEMAPRLAPLLMTLGAHKDPGVAAAAAQALGKLPPDPKAVAVFQKLLAKDMRDSRPRRGAAEGLVHLIRAANRREWSAARFGTGGGPEAPPLGKVLLDLTLLVVPVASGGLKDPDALVRVRCAEVLREAAEGLKPLAGMMASAGSGLPAPTPRGLGRRGREEGPNPNPQKPDQTGAATLGPAVSALKKAIRPLAANLNPRDPAVCLAASGALETFAELRQSLLRHGFKNDPMGKGLQEALEPLAKNLSDRNVRVQLGALYVLETIGPAAAGVMKKLVKTLDDPNAFVRWGALRALAKMPPPDARKAVTKVGRLLTDPSGDVRASAAVVLERYGPRALPAVAAICEAVNTKEATTRRLAIRVLAAVGPGAKKEALPALVTALRDPKAEAAVRAAAAQSLARFGPAKRETAAALRKALEEDPDASVRLAAGEALLEE
jgi:HEAT repeat protein